MRRDSEKRFIRADCPECLDYKTRACDGKKKVCNPALHADFKQPMLFILLDTCPDNLTKVLRHFNVAIIETNYHPYFTLTFN